MKRILFALLLLCSSSFAATWFADATGNANAITWHATNGNASCAAGTGGTLTWPPAAGDTLDAHYCTVTFVSAGGDPGTNGIITITNSGTAGGFACVSSAGPTNITANVTGAANGAAMLAISGVAGGACNVGKNGSTVTVVGGSAASSTAITDSRSSGATALTHFANITGGSIAGAYGYAATGTGSETINGTVTGATTQGYNGSGSETLTVTNCVGSDTAVISGCAGITTTTIVVTGNMIFGKKGPPTFGPTLYTPSATNCVMVPGASVWATTPSSCLATDATHQQLPADNNIKTVTNVVNGVAYGSYTGTNTGGANSGSAN